MRPRVLRRLRHFRPPPRRPTDVLRNAGAAAPRPGRRRHGSGAKRPAASFTKAPGSCPTCSARRSWTGWRATAAIGHTLYLRRGERPRPRRSAAAVRTASPGRVGIRVQRRADQCRGAPAATGGRRLDFSYAGGHRGGGPSARPPLPPGAAGSARVSLAAVEAASPACGSCPASWWRPGTPTASGRCAWANSNGWSGGDPVLEEHRRTAWVVASETCALDTVGAEFVRDIEPGEVLAIDDEGSSRAAGRWPPAAPLLFRIRLFRPSRQQPERAQRPHRPQKPRPRTGQGTPGGRGGGHRRA